MRKTKEIEDGGIFDKVINSANSVDRLFVTKSLEISNQIIDILEEKGLLRKDFAEIMGKSESEISKWLSGFHNFTISTICKIEAALGTTIITTPKQSVQDMHTAFFNLVSRANTKPQLGEMKEIKSEWKHFSFEDGTAKIVTMPQKNKFVPAESSSLEEESLKTGTYS